MFGINRGKRTKENELKSFDPEKQKPILRCSICTGEQVAGFKDLATGKFEDIMLIKSPKDLETFKKTYHITDITKEY